MLVPCSIFCLFFFILPVGTMKILFVFVTFFIVSSMAWTEERTALRRYALECAGKTGLTVDVIHDSLLDGIKGGKKKADCFATCILQKTGIMTKRGLINELVLKRKAHGVTDKQMDKIVDECVPLTAQKNCKSSTKFIICIMKIVTIDGLKLA